jgi:hypothetical protein
MDDESVATDIAPDGVVFGFAKPDAVANDEADDNMEDVLSLTVLRSARTSATACKVTNCCSSEAKSCPSMHAPSSKPMNLSVIFVPEDVEVGYE